MTHPPRSRVAAEALASPLRRGVAALSLAQALRIPADVTVPLGAADSSGDSKLLPWPPLLLLLLLLLPPVLAGFPFEMNPTRKLCGIREQEGKKNKYAGQTEWRGQKGAEEVGGGGSGGGRGAGRPG